MSKRKPRQSRTKMAGIDREYQFVIQAYSPETFPMLRLAEYMRDLAMLIGEEDRVHFVRLAAGSTAVVHRIEFEALPKVRDRLRAVRNHEGPREAIDAFAGINDRLAFDNASARIVEPGGRNVLEFPGRRAHKELEYGPLSQRGELIGSVIVVGGKNDPVPVHLQDGDKIYVCQARRDLARQLASHLLGDPIRVIGTGRWFRDSHGSWEMREFRIAQLEVLDGSSLKAAIERLRRINAEWRGHPDPLKDLSKLRTM
jgi:hypothetical protein